MAAIMHKTSWITVLALVFSLALSVQAQQARKTIMVVDFEDVVQGWSMTREMVTGKLIVQLREDQNLRVLPRDRVAEALRQAKLEASGYVDREEVLKVAKALEADYVLMGQVAAFDQQSQGVSVGFVSVHTMTATVKLRGKVLGAASEQFVASPEIEVKKQQGGGSVWVGPWWTQISVNNFDSQLIGKATLEAVEQFVARAKPHLK